MSSPRFDTNPLAAGRFGSQRRVRRGVWGSCMQAPDGVALRKPSCGNSKRKAGKIGRRSVSRYVWGVSIHVNAI